MLRHSGNGWLATGFIFYIILYLLTLRKSKNKIHYSLLFWYCAIVIDLTLFPIPTNADALLHIREQHQFSLSLNLLKDTTRTQIFLNFIMFIPLGVLLPYVCPKLKGTRVLLSIFFATLSIELIQLLTSFLRLNVRIFDIDDLLFNFLGGLLGYIIYLLISKQKKLK